jgi:predicted RNA-binding Zn-ribbon protein involved in translation (DUF1610 family)
MPDAPDDLPVAKPVAKDPTVSKNPPQGRKFPCPECGARLDFDPGTRGLACPYCGHQEKITRDSDAKVIERDYLKYLEDLETRAEPIPGRTSQTRCTGCGALVLLEEKVATDTCPFCRTHLENEPVAVVGMLAPDTVLPFAVELREARDAFTHWIGNLWFAPTELKAVANLGQLTGVYLPYWTYDTMTYSFYEGERGDNYYETVHRTVRLADGRTEQRAERVVRVRWTSVSGEVQHFFDDVLVCGSQSLPQWLIDGLEPWDLGKLVPFQPDYLSGFKTERYVVGLKEGFQVAKSLIEPEIISLIHRDIGGDHQRIHDKNTEYSAITFKHMLLPAWVAVYRYHDQTYQILVNGRTGKVVGRRPWSYWKIARLVILFLLAAVLVMVLTSVFGK